MVYAFAALGLIVLIAVGRAIITRVKSRPPASNRGSLARKHKDFARVFGRHPKF